MPTNGFALRELVSAVRDATRLAAVRDAGLLDAPRSSALDRLAMLCQRVLDVPVVLITLVDAERDYIIGGAGLFGVLAQTREIRVQPTFSQYTVATREAYTVDDAPQHPLFSTFPGIMDTPIIACANAPLVTMQGIVLGNVCAIDHAPRHWSTDAVDTLAVIADSVVTELELRMARRAVERSAHQALHDPLTGLANRTLFMDRVEHALARSIRGENVAVLFVDLDDFKEINDRLGHAEGDALLENVAVRLRQATRTSDTVARLGGDEFAVLLEGMSADSDATAAAARITASLQPSVVLQQGQEVQVSASIGVAHTRGSDTVDELLRNADLAMYRAKRSGKGTTATFGPAMQAAMRDRVQLSDDVRRAIDANELHMLYQPIVDLATGVMRGAEALARWQHPTRGIVGPMSFIPLAEESSAILSIGRWSLKDACAQLRTWDAEWGMQPADVALRRRYGAPSVHVNIAGRHLYDPSLARNVIDAIEAAGIAPERVVLEISESVLMQRMEQAMAAFHALKETGVRIAIDDFGTGASSLKYLQQFPIDILKIDRRFVAELGAEGGSTRLARGVVALGEALELQLIAEGVESPVQRRELRMLGCHQAQGYLFSQAIPASKIVGWAAGQLTHQVVATGQRRAGLGLVVERRLR